MVFLEGVPELLCAALLASAPEGGDGAGLVLLSAGPADAVF